MKGKFITFEGCEGVGKSHQLRRLKEYLELNNIKFFATREPGGNVVSEKIREIILDKNNTSLTDECEALLYASARAQLLKEVIKPKLDNGELVICDRYIDSSIAYQGYARGLGEEFVESINSYAIKNFMPDLTIFLDLPPIEAFKRKGGVDKNDRLELSGMEFHNKVYEGYLSLAKKYPNRIVKIDASGSKEQTQEKIINALKENGII
ncbi:MAG: dTMP kinase [Firmicutes bacterium]|nr:dTMP kinase [Candidatus Caballimonas caccae]